MSVSRMRSPSVVGYFDDLAVARKAIQQLKDFGFDPSRVGCALATVEDPEHAGIWSRLMNFFIGDAPGSVFASSLAFLNLPWRQQCYLEQKLCEGGAVIIVFDAGRAERARQILNACGAEWPGSREFAEDAEADPALWIKLIGKCAECAEQVA